MLEDNFTLKPIEEYGQVALFSPNAQGSYKIELNVRHKWTGKILSTEYYDILASGNISNNENNQAYDKKEISNTDKDTKIKKERTGNSYSVQVSSWSKESDSIKEKKMLEKLGYSPYIEKFNYNNQLWWRIRLGPYSSKKQAKNICNKVNKALNKKCWIDLSDGASGSDYKEPAEKKTIEVENLINYEEEPVERKESNEYYIQISTWTTKEDAENEIKKIKALGYKPFILEDYDKNNQLWHKVRIGPLSNQESINLKYKISKDLGKNVWVDKNN